MGTIALAAGFAVMTGCAGARAPLPRAGSIQDVVAQLRSAGLSCLVTSTDDPRAQDQAECSGSGGGQHTPCPSSLPATAQCLTDAPQVRVYFARPTGESTNTVTYAGLQGNVFVDGANFTINTPPSLADEIEKATGGRLETGGSG